eukprot:187864_1
MVIVHCAIIALLLVATPSVQSAAREALLPSNHSTQRYGTQRETRVIRPLTDLPQELIEKTCDCLNYFDIHSLRYSSNQMRNNPGLLFIENQAYCSFLNQSFSVLLNQTRLTIEDLKRIARTNPLRINHSELETFMHKNRNKASIFIGTDNELNKTFIAFNLCPVKADSDNSTTLKFVFDELSGRIVDVVGSNWPDDCIVGSNWPDCNRRNWINIVFTCEELIFFTCEELIKTGSVTIDRRIFLVLLPKPMTWKYFKWRYPRSSCCMVIIGILLGYLIFGCLMRLYCDLSKKC